MAKPELGAKRQCQNCGAKFFDLNKDPIVCPKCGTVFQGAAARAGAAAKDEEEDSELAAPAGVELVSLDEVEAGEEKAAEPVVDDIDVEDDAGRPGRPVPRGGRGRRRRRQQPHRRRYRARRRRLRRRRDGRAASPGRRRNIFSRSGLVAAQALRSIPPPARTTAASPQSKPRARVAENGAIAQLGERFNGIEEVVGSIPSGSTTLCIQINKIDQRSCKRPYRLRSQIPHRYQQGRKS